MSRINGFATASLAALLAATGWASAARGEDAPPPVQFTLDYKAEGWANTQGGLQRTQRYLDLLTASLAVDGESALGWHGGQAYASVISTHGRALGPVVGDANGISNIDADGVKAVWLYEAWLEQSFDWGLSIRAGAQELNAEFDVGGVKSLFLNATQGLGTDIAQSGQNGPSTYPYTSLGVRLKQTFGENWYVQGIALDAVPGDPSRPKHTAFRLNRHEGALFVAEAGWEGDGAKYYVGGWTYTARFADLDTTRPDHRRNHGVYAHAEHALTEKLAGFVRAGLANGDLNPFDSYLAGGLAYTGLAMADDQIGLAVAHAHASAPYRASVGATKAETALELTWKLQPLPWLSVQPDVQYVVNPGLDPTVRDALVVGLRLDFNMALPR